MSSIEAIYAIRTVTLVAITWGHALALAGDLQSPDAFAGIADKAERLRAAR